MRFFVCDRNALPWQPQGGSRWYQAAQASFRETISSQTRINIRKKKTNPFQSLYDNQLPLIEIKNTTISNVTIFQYAFVLFVIYNMIYLGIKSALERKTFYLRHNKWAVGWFSNQKHNFQELYPTHAEMQTFQMDIFYYKLIIRVLNLVSVMLVYEKTFC